MSEEYTLTSDELEAAVALKKACEEEDLKYKSNFELVKYVLVTSSLPTPERRLENALSRLRKLRSFEEKYNIDAFDPLDSVKSIDKEMPGWLFSCGKIDGKWGVPGNVKDLDSNFLNRVENGFEMLCAAEFRRYNLCAANLGEARTGMCIIGSARGLAFAQSWQAPKFFHTMNCTLDSMHTNRIKAIWWELPTVLSAVAQVVIKVLPKTLKSRIHVATTLTELPCWEADDFLDNLPETLGGKYNIPIVEWYEMRQKEFDLTVKHLESAF